MVRKTKYDHNVVVALPNDGTKAISKDAWNDGHNEFGMNGHGSVTIITISSGNLAPVNDMHIVSGEGAVADDLTNIDNTDTAEFDEIWLYAGSELITVKDQAGGTGQIFTISGDDTLLSTTIPMKIIRKGTNWFEVGTAGGAPISLIFGDGSDGDAINPVLSGGDVKQYNNLTISSNVTWIGTGIIIVRVKGTFDLQSGNTITVNTLGNAGTSGGSGSGLGGNGGNAPSNRGTVIFIANTTIGTGTISSTGINGSNGGDGVAPTGSNSGNDADDNDKTEAFGILFNGPTGGKAGGNNGTAGNGGTSYSITNISKVIDMFLSHFQDSGPTGGGEGQEQNTGSPQTHGGGGGAGGGNGVAKGGSGETGTLSAASLNSTGGGGSGGGTAALVIIITKTITAINIILTGGTSGIGGIGTNNVTRADGGGGAVGSITIAQVDNINYTLTGGNGNGGNDGETKKVFGTFEDFAIIVQRAI